MEVCADFFLQNKWTGQNIKLDALGYSHVKYISMHVIETWKGTRIENSSIVEDDFSFHVVTIFWEMQIKFLRNN